MAGFMKLVLILDVSLSLLSTVLAVPPMRRKVAPIFLYGFRVRRTLEDPRVWYDANAFAGRCLFGFGLGTGLACLALYFLPAIEPVVSALACLMIVLVGLAVSLILSFRFLNQLTHQ